ncbi:glucose-6-phosphate dehydrogenase [Tenacibaculum pacificus]|uniref:glucose-6-phosphate dehydrogenase n=1 Tax=Tenacibaculum pacificus TaxID=3018314 RepID=UPI0022F3E2F5|nr:glucose-6-phosphate dehydrogenase [Tenacibaculum pacificus]WBX73957.1 glucose-6-phosphate dehydrogenase [Tenacibaculum pacificus]
MSKKDKMLEAFNFVIFGGDGDLAMRKIYPALFCRFAEQQIGGDFNIVVIIRDEMPIEPLLEKIKEQITVADKKIDFNSEVVADFISKITVILIKNHSIKTYQPLKNILQEHSNYQDVFYFSTPSSVFVEICDTLRESSIVNTTSKVVLEKPLGNSLASFEEINTQITKTFSEKQIYRIDHYLGKETVQNLMVLRFSNHLFERSWDSEHIDNVQITVAENLGVGTRGGYYDKSGALLDMVQNHLLQLLCLVAMEPPISVEADQMRNEKLKVLQSLRMLNAESVKTDTVRGQYTRGKINKTKVSSYLEDINKYASNTETFVALKAYVDNWRWKGVPFYLRTGKRLEQRYSEIVINFKSVKHNIFNPETTVPNNKLIIRLQPEERISIVQMTKIPGPGGYRYKPISLKLDYLDSFNERLPEAYERLLIDVLRGNQTLFMREDELRAAWTWIESITDNWKKIKQPIDLYEAGTTGPRDSVMSNGDTWEIHS